MDSNQQDEDYNQQQQQQQNLAQQQQSHLQQYSSVIDQPKKALISRLYKNFSVSQIDNSMYDQSQILNRDQSILNNQSSFLGQSAIGPPQSFRQKKMNRPLVPKIQLQRRLQPLQGNQLQSSLPMVIENGKVLLNTTKNQNDITMKSFDFSLTKSKPKLNKINPGHLSNIGKKHVLSQHNLDESIIPKKDLDVTWADDPHINLNTTTNQQNNNNQQQQQLSNNNLNNTQNNKKLKKKLKDKRNIKPMGKQLKKDQEKQQEDYLTPMDFIHLIRTDAEMADEFAYLIKESHPYDFKIVEYEEVNKHKQEYMTISARGITHFVNDEATFMTVEEWEREAKMFHQLLDIDFFKKYKKWKSFSLWKKLTRTNQMKKFSDQLNQKLFSVDRYLGLALLKVRELCLISQTISYMDTNFTEGRSMEDFKTHQEIYRQHNTDQKLDQIENTIKSLVIDNCKKSLKTFKEDNRIQTDDKEDQNLDEQPPLLIGDETGKDMPYTQEATIRTHYKRLKHFVKLIDYIFLDSKIHMVNECTQRLIDQLQDFNDQEDGRYYGNQSPWIIVQAQHVGTELVYNPDKDYLKKLFEDIIQKSVIRICQKHKQFINLEELEPYIKVGDESVSSEPIDLLPIIQGDKTFKINFDIVKNEVQISFECVEKYGKFLVPFLEKYEKNIQLKVESFSITDNEEFKKSILNYQTEHEQFQNIEPQQELGLAIFDNSKLKDEIKNSAQKCLNQIQEYLPQLLEEKVNKLLDKIREHNRKIGYLPTTVEKFVEFQEDVNVIGNQLDDLTAERGELQELEFIVSEFNIRCSESIKSKAKDAQNALVTLRQKIDDALNSNDTFQAKFRRDLDNMIPQVNDKLKDIVEKLEDIPYSKLDSDQGKTIEQIKEISSSLQELQKETKKIMEWQLALQTDVNNFEKLSIFQREFQTLEKLWNGKDNWNKNHEKWSTSSFLKINIDEMGDTMEKLSKTANFCAKELEANEVARAFKQEIEQYKNVLQLLQSLRDPALKDENWDQIRELVTPEDEDLEHAYFHDLNDVIYTVGWIERNNIMKDKDKISEIALKAVKEAELVKMLKSVEQVWETASLVVQNYKDRTDMFILGNNEDLIGKLDDTLLTLNNILASRFVDRIRSKVNKQNKLFKYLQELLDEWILHQRNWLYLEPILSSPYAAKTMPKEVKLFQNCDSKWKQMMKKANDFQRADYWAKDYQARGYINQLQKNNDTFEVIQKALDELLEKKREVFQRFFFLSNDELLEILSQGTNLKSVVHHLRKCFENIVKLDFDRNEIVQNMISAEGEKMPLKNYNAKGEDVEIWFKDLEDKMKESLKVEFKKSLLKYEDDDTQRKDWVLEYGSQIILGLDAVFWARMTEENYLGPEAFADLFDWLDAQINQLEELTELIRGDLTELQRKTLSALVVQDVHYRDIIEQLANDGVESTNNFQWQQQLRLYYEDALGNGSWEIFCRQVNARLPYGYEYLGASSRLVITPLTDRCWMTITGALGIKLGAAPAGPAGTGKTESCKDLAKVLGRYCIVFNCSDQINVKMMEKLFMGCCFTGAWTCLDEFNRIDIEVLSVIAQQVLTIREAHLDEKDKFEFFGKQVTFGATADMGIFTTMNPGYAGRTELPDNLKILFRPVAMMVPDYTLIAEIMLFSEGFGNAKGLSRKMTKLYKLSSEQLSQQDHYDFGMRAVKSVLVMAGSLKRAEPDASEELVLIRAMRDSNVPKFLSHDIPLFNAIVQDLFPGLDIPPIANQQLEEVIKQKLTEKKLLHEPNFIEKILQFHETLKVRFGVMIVGPTMGGKSTCSNTLRDSYIQLAQNLADQLGGEENNNHPQFQNILSSVLNPKAISMEELYGDFDPLSQSWTDGLASTIMRNYGMMEDKQKKWITFDGPVDAIWIENMNSVLDDSMTLCLSNGERIKLKPQIRMLFEVLDLAVASPATVSRCGMVYIDADVVGYQPIVESYFETELAELIKAQDLRQHLMNNLFLAFKKILLPLKKMKTQILTCDANLAMSICRNLKLILELDPGIVFLEQKDTAKKSLEKLLLWAFSWGIGAALQTQDRTTKFEFALRDIFSSDIQPKGSVFDYYYEFSKPEGEFMPFEEIKPEFFYNPDMSYFQLMVPTKDTVCYGWLLERSISLLSPIFLTGMTGTGKTSIVQNSLEKMNQEGTISSLQMTFSAKTSAINTQLQIEGKLASQRKKGQVILMPPPGKKLAIFVDDINMPQVETYGAQPPIELLRQYMDYKGVYDRKQLFWKSIDSTVLVACAAPPGGGRSALTVRFTRHFNVVSVPDSSEDCLRDIFSSIFVNFTEKRQFTKEIRQLAESNKIVQATLNIYTDISKALLPTPAKSHYLFNLRDVSKVFQGLLQAKNMDYQKKEDFSSLWIHEMTRVFHDRLINDEDRDWFQEAMVKEALSFGKEVTKEELFQGEVPLIFGNFLDKGVDLENRRYVKVNDYQRLKKVIDDYMMEETKLNLVLFRDAIEHMSRIARALMMERGHFMLVGVGGSGKKSLTTIASALADCKLDTIEIKKAYNKKDFKEDLYRMMKTAGIDNYPLVFLFSDTQILQEGFLEDINNLLNSGEVPNMLVKEELDEINNELSQEARQLNYNSAYELFVDRVRSQMHIVLALSPVGDKLKERMRMFPSIVNCCTLNWLNPWPEEALLTVAKMNIETIEFEELTPELRQGVAECCMYTHKTVESACDKFYDNLRRKVYITPKSYIDMIDAYKSLLKLKSEELTYSKNKLSNGLFKLKEANELIAGLKIKLKDLQPVLEQQTIEIQELIEVLKVDRVEANKVREVVEEDEAIVQEKADEILGMKQEADGVLKAAMPKLEAANKALDILDRKILAEIKGNNSPNPLVKFTLECVNILFEQSEKWEDIKKLLSDPNLLQKMKEYDVFNMKEKVEINIKKKIASNPDFIPSVVEKKSSAAKAICEWVRGVADFTVVNKEINDKKGKVAKMDVELAEQNKLLAVKQAELKKVVDKVEALETKFKDSQAKLDSLKEEKKVTAARLIRAEELTTGLADEQVRWKETVENLTASMSLLIGDIYISASCVAYYGPFTGVYRQELVDLWVEKANELEIPSSEKFALDQILGDPVTIRNWNAKGLPSDTVSINNGILVFNSKSVPLLIDPQLQASKWIKNLEQQNNFSLCKMNSPELSKLLENGLRMGIPLIIEDMEEHLEAILEPLLMKEFKIVNRRKMVRIGDTEVEYDPNFRLYIMTKIPNPNFLPDIFIRCTVINFTVTELGLEEQLLGDVVKIEMPEVEQQKNELIVQIADGKTMLKQNEDSILEMLANSKGMILDDVELIEKLKESKITAGQVKNSLAYSEEKQVEIDAARQQYKPVAIRGSILFFVIANLALIDPMYQFSLSYFKRLFVMVIENTEKNEEIEERVKDLINQITEIIFLNVCRGLFNDHKKIFSFLVTAAIKQNDKSITKPEWSAFVKGSLGDEKVPLPQNTKINEKMWQKIVNLKNYSPKFETLAQDIASNIKIWEAFLFSKDPFLQEAPAPYNFLKKSIKQQEEEEQEEDQEEDKKITKNLNYFQHLILIRCLREEKTLYAMNNYVDKVMGKKFSQTQAETMEQVFKDTDYKTPWIFILSQGADPLLSLLRFSKDMKVPQEKLAIISLGQGQGPIAEKALDIAIKNGGWVILQNCHLGKSFMPTLEKRIEGLHDPELEYNPDFRLFLTSMPADYFPVSILQNGVKLTNEPPKGLKANIMKSYADLSVEKFENCDKKDTWKTLLFSLCFFHAIIQERRKFGPLGWNIRYEFNDSDLDTAQTILKLLLDSNDQIPWQALRYVIGDITYGGRVTDDQDRRTLTTILKYYMSEEVMEQNYSFSESGIYVSPQIGDLEQYRNVIDRFPEYEQPEVFGMHDNANIAFELKESKNALETILNIQPRDTGASQGDGKSTDQIIEEMCDNLELKLPPILVREQQVQSKKQTKRASVTNEKATIDSLQVCMKQECERFNKLLRVMQKSMKDLKKALKGEVVMSGELDLMSQSLLNNQVPQIWMAKSYPSLKPLASWYEDLILRCKFFNDWLNLAEGNPVSYWISAFFFPQGFLTSILQNYARKHSIAIDKLSFTYRYLNHSDPNLLGSHSEHGQYIYGLFIEGCGYDFSKCQLDDSQPGVMYIPSPIIEFIPMENYKKKDEDYSMPVYKTILRKGTLSTTGHSTNFIIAIDVPAKKSSSYWILKGAAFVCMLND